ncbi:MAG: hypothetical protein WC441_04700, partial [Patescibacteria group bacterium]
GGYIKAGWYIKAGEYIEAGWHIKAGWYIEAGGYIKAGGYIEAGEYIEAGGYIEAGEYIETGWYIEAGGYVFSFTFALTCKVLITHQLPFGREFWAGIPALPEKFRDKILDTSKCWPDYQQMFTKKQAQQICKWEGWHWILRAQLEMFFGLKEEYKLTS